MLDENTLGEVRSFLTRTSKIEVQVGSSEFFLNIEAELFLICS